MSGFKRLQYHQVQLSDVAFDWCEMEWQSIALFQFPAKSLAIKP
jgi:hypothetical protein